MAVTADTIRLITQGEYTVGSTGTISDADFASFLQFATAQFSIDNPGNATESVSDLAIGLLVCHYIDRGKNDQSIKSEDAGDGSTSFDGSGSNWKKSYDELISGLKTKLARDNSGTGVTKQPSRGVVRKDAGSIYLSGATPSSLF